jgi:hypothetical protein
LSTDGLAAQVERLSPSRQIQAVTSATTGGKLSFGKDEAMTVNADDAMISIRPRHLLLRILACVVILVGLMAWGLTVLYQDFVKGMASAVGAAMGAVVESGAVNAADAANVAHRTGVGVGQITVAQVRNGDSTKHWVSGTVASTGFNVVSLDAVNDHLTTAVEPAGPHDGCAYGLAVSSSNDSIVAADSLSGSGVFYTFVVPATACVATLAPTSGWTKISNPQLQKAGLSAPPNR